PLFLIGGSTAAAPVTSNFAEPFEAGGNPNSAPIRAGCSSGARPAGPTRTQGPLPLKTPAHQSGARAISGVEALVFAWRTELRAGPEREVISPDGVRCFASKLGHRN